MGGESMGEILNSIMFSMFSPKSVSLESVLFSPSYLCLYVFTFSVRVLLKYAQGFFHGPKT